MPPLPLPPAARFLAGDFTTRETWQTSLLRLLAPLESLRSPGAAFYALGPGQAFYGDAARVESFARPLWGLAALAAGGAVPMQGIDWEAMRAGLANGCDPRHPEFWGKPAPFGDQRYVEMAAIGFALAIAPGHFWIPLPPDARRKVALWLGAINAATLPDNNWLWFRILVNLALRSVGEAWDAPRMTADLDRLESFYLGDGWHADGLHENGAGGRRGDYYVGMALQFYPLLYIRLAPPGDEARVARFRERATAFARQFVHWFSDDGAAIPFGRSLTYRFAQGAFWAGLAFAGIEALPWGEIRGVLARQMRWWARQPILDAGGLLSIGYAQPNLLVAENYNSPASPYWALKAFLVLALPADHPFWTAPESPPPPRPAILPQRHAGKILTSGPSPADVVALNLGDRREAEVWVRNGDAKYQKFAYGTGAGFAVSAGDAHYEWGGFDSTLAFSLDGAAFRARRVNQDQRFDAGFLWSRWKPLPGITVETWLLPLHGGHLRLHHVAASVPCVSREAGFAVNRLCAAGAPVAEGGELRLDWPDGFTGIRDLLGGASALCVELEPHTHLLHPLAAMPVLHRAQPAGAGWLATFVLHSTDAPAGRRAWETACDGLQARLAEADELVVTRGGDTLFRACPGPGG